jgi:hypothetical protein
MDLINCKTHSVVSETKAERHHSENNGAAEPVASGCSWPVVDLRLEVEFPGFS